MWFVFITYTIMTKLQELQQKYLAKIEDAHNKIQTLEEGTGDFDKLRKLNEEHNLRTSIMAYYDFIHDLIKLEEGQC